MKLINPTDKDYKNTYAGFTLDVKAHGAVDISLQDILKLTKYARLTFKIFDDGSKLVQLASKIIGLTKEDPTAVKKVETPKKTRKKETVEVKEVVEKKEIKEESKKEDKKVEVKVEAKVEVKSQEKK